MAKRRRDLLALRAIVVSGRAALLKTPDTVGRDQIKKRILELLVELEEGLIRDGADAEVVALVKDAHRQF
jgi:hypothetical protein